MAAQALHAISCPFLWHAAIASVNPQLAPSPHMLGLCTSAMMTQVWWGRLP